MDNSDSFLITAELAVKLKTSKSFVCKNARAGIIPFTKIGRQYRFDLNKVKKALAKANAKGEI